MSSSEIKDKVKCTVCKSQFWGFFVSMAVMAVVSLAFFAPNNFNGDSLSQYDMQQGAANGEEARHYYEETGEKALWTNALFSGMPTFQISPSYPSNSLFTWLNDVYGLWLPAPSNLLFMMMMGMLIMCYCLKMRWYYALIAALGWGLSSYFVIIIGAGHIWKFMALTYMPPTIGAAVMAYRGKWLSGGTILALFAMLELNANHPQITYYSFFIMAALAIAFLVMAIKERKMRTWLVGTAVCVFSGALAVGSNAPSLYNTYEYSKETKRAQSELSPLSPAQAEAALNAERPTGGLPKEEIGGWSNSPSETFALLVPNLKGGASIRPEKGQNRPLFVSELAQGNYQAQEADQFGLMDQFMQYFGGKGLTNGPFYVGAFIFALFLLGCLIVKGPVKWAFLFITIFSALLAMGNHFEALTDFMIYNVPLYNKFRAAETALVMAALCIPALGLLGLQQLFTTENAWKTYRWQTCVAFGVPALIAAIAWLAPSTFGEPFADDELYAIENMTAQLTAQQPEYLDIFRANVDMIAALRLDMVSADGGRSLLIILIGALVVINVIVFRAKAWLGALGAGIVILGDLYTVDKRYVSSESFVDASYADAGAVNPLAPDVIDNEINKDKSYYRVADLNEFGGYRRSYFHHMVGGYHAAKLNRYNDLIERELNGGPNMEKILSMLNAKYIITPGNRQAGEGPRLIQNPAVLGAAWLVDSLYYVDNADAEMAAFNTLDPATTAVADKRFKTVLGEAVPSVVPGDTVVMDKYTPNQLTYTVTTKNGGLCVFSEVWFPWGWKATIDGNPAELGRVNYILRAMRIPAGKHEVVMSFDPDSLHVTGAVAYSCVTIIYLLCLLAIFCWLTRKEEEKC